MGAVFARQLAAQGYDLWIVARRAAALDGLAVDLRGRYGVTVQTVVADLTRDEDVDSLGDRLANVPFLELLVNNAGFGSRGLFFESDPKQQEDMHRLHVLATERLTRAALPGMVGRGRGGIINVASTAGFFPAPGNASYCATKAWMITFTEGLYLELKRIGSPVKVQALCPGYTHTEFHDVLKVDRSKIMTPGWWMTAEDVVAESLRGFSEGRLLVIPGWRYRAVVAFTRLLPRRLMLAAVARVRSPAVE